MPKSLTDAKSPEDAMKIFEERVLLALKPPAMLDVEKFNQFLEQKGGQFPQPFPAERTPRTTQPSTRVNLGG